LIFKKKEFEEFDKIFINKGYRHFNNLYLVNKKNFQKGCGSYLFNGFKYEYDRSFLEKQSLLFNLCKKNQKILEIGVYMGHSILIMLLANSKADITGIDINDFYAKPSIEYLKDSFPDAKLNLIVKPSLKALNNLKGKFDLFHVDGSHTIPTIAKEFNFLINLRKDNNFKILFDDINFMLPLKNNIEKSFNIYKTFLANSKHPNYYIEIKIDEQKIKKQLNVFKIRYLKMYLTNLIIIDLYKIVFLSSKFGFRTKKFLEEIKIYNKIKVKIKKILSHHTYR
jgi:hypothetical protein